MIWHKNSHALVAVVGARLFSERSFDVVLACSERQRELGLFPP
jgi:hypothetical protein